MAKCSCFQLGSLASQSYAERMNSAGKNIVNDNRAKLDHDTIDKLVVLCMNKKFMDFCMKNIPCQRKTKSNLRTN